MALDVSGVSIDNWSFKLYYKVTAGLIVLCSFLVSGRQFFGNPIHCDAGSVSFNYHNIYKCSLFSLYVTDFIKDWNFVSWPKIDPNIFRMCLFYRLHISFDILWETNLKIIRDHLTITYGYFSENGNFSLKNLRHPYIIFS